MVVAALAITISATGATAAPAEPSKSSLTKQITDLQNQLESITESYNKMNIDLQRTISDEKTLAASLGPAKDALKAATAQMQTIAATYYKTGQVGAVNVLFDGDGAASDMLDRLDVIDQISRSRARDITNYTATTQNYNARQAALKLDQNKKTAQVNQLAKARSTIEAKIKVLEAKSRAATGHAQDSSGNFTAPAISVAGAAGQAVSYAKAHLGDWYHYAAAGPSTFDCSGLTMMAWAAAGKSLPHNAAEQYSATARISRSELAAGDLVFYRNNDHVAIYIGGGSVIAAPHTGARVQVQPVDVMTPNGYGRVR